MKGWTRRRRRNWPVEKIGIIGVAAERRTIDGGILVRLDKGRSDHQRGRQGWGQSQSKRLPLSEFPSFGLFFVYFSSPLVMYYCCCCCWSAVNLFLMRELKNCSSHCDYYWRMCGQFNVALLSWMVSNAAEKYLSTLQVIARNFAILCEPFYCTFVKRVSEWVRKDQFAKGRDVLYSLINSNLEVVVSKLLLKRVEGDEVIIS